MDTTPAPTRVTAELLDLLRRYDRPGPRYTSYPTAVEFHEGVDGAAYESKLAEADAVPDEPLSLYFHLPFCRERCTFCGCSVVVTRKPEVVGRYLDYLRTEIKTVAARLPHRRAVNQIHWGGGTPTHLDSAGMRALWEEINRHFTLVPGAEVAIEVDPRVTTHEQVDTLRALGFNRLSMGVQDFTLEVQEAIGRHQGVAETLDLFRYSRAAGFPSINVDLVYGLPRQEPESFRRNLEQLIAQSPDRVAVYSFAFVPWVKANQRRLDPAAFPSPQMKFELFLEALEAFAAAGYAQIGMDHFALPTDELAVAQREGRLHRNFMGYTVMPAADQLGFGITAIGDLRGAFVQNRKKLVGYYEALDAGRLPVERGYLLDNDDQIRRQVILRLMCNFSLDTAEVESRFGIRFADYFAAELEELQVPQESGFVRVTPGRIEVTERGRLFIRNIGMIFDRYLRTKRAGDTPVFSRTV
jgi:oxygen-independent coproporphyrinogen III oxidase